MPFSEEVLEDQGHERVKGEGNRRGFRTWLSQRLVNVSEPVHGSFGPAEGVRRRLRESRCELGFAG